MRYVAPEILSTNVTSDDYTEKSDVYSMGVFMWEDYSRGTIPWSKISDDNDLINGELLPNHRILMNHIGRLFVKLGRNSLKIDQDLMN